MAKFARAVKDDGKLWNPPASLTSEELVDKEVTLTIDTAGEEMVPDPKTGQPKKKPIVRFKETPRYLVCNRTNEGFLCEKFGKKLGGWRGKRVTLYAVECSFGRERTTGIRLKLPKEAPNAKPEPSNPDGAPDTRPGVPLPAEQHGDS